MSLRYGRWQSGIRSYLVLPLVVGMLLIPGAGANADQTSKNRITLDVADADLVRVVDMLRSAGNANIVVSKPDEIKAKVSARLQGVTLETALKAVVEGANYSWWRDDNGIYYINSDRPKATAEQIATPVTTVAQTPKEIRMEKIRLRYVNPSIVCMQLGIPGGGDPTNFRLENSQEPTIPVSYGSDLNSKPGSYNVTDVTKPGYTPPAPAITPLGSTSRVDPMIAGRTASDSNPFTANQGGGFGGGISRGAPSLGSVNGNNNAAGGANGQNKLLPDDIFLVMPYEIDNSLVVRGTDVAIDELKQVIRMLDVAPKQVQIKAEFIEISVNDEQALGLDWSIQTLDTDVSATGMAPSGNLSMKFASGNIQATLSALKTSGHAKVKNSPIISTMNNVPASINVGTQYVYFLSTTTTSSNVNPVITYNPASLQVNTGLWVLPRVNGDGSITVTLQPQVQDVVGTKKSPAGDEIPTTTYRTLTTSRRIGDGDTIVIGGLNSAHDERNESGLPFLKDLPLVGQFFRSTTVRNNDTELLIFVTPTVLPEPTSSNGVSAE